MFRKREVQEPLLSVARLRSPVRRHYYTEQTENGSGFSTPYNRSAPSSPHTRGYYARPEFEEALFGEVCVAIPFSWEEVPGTPSRNFGSKCGGQGDVDQMSETLGSSETGDRSIVGSSDQVSQTDSEHESSDPVHIISRECYSHAFKFNSAHFYAADQVETFSPVVASPPVLTPDEFDFKGRTVPMLSLPSKLQHLDAMQPSISSTASPSSDSSNSCSAWPNSNERGFRSPIARSLALSPAWSPARSGSDTSHPASIPMTLFGVPIASESGNCPDSNPIQLGTKERTGRRLDRRGHRSSRSFSPLRRFKCCQDNEEMVPILSRGSTTPAAQCAVVETSSKSGPKASSLWLFCRNEKRRGIRSSITSPQVKRVHEGQSGSQVNSKPKSKFQSKDELKTKKQTGNRRNTSPKALKDNPKFWTRASGGIKLMVFSRNQKFSSRSTISPFDLHITQEEWERMKFTQK